LNSADHLTQKSQGAAYNLGFLFYVHVEYLQAKLYQKLDAVTYVIQLKHVFLELEVEKNLTHYHFYAEIEHLVVELHFFILALHVKFKRSLENSLEESHQRVNLDQVAKMTAKIDSAV